MRQQLFQDSDSLVAENNLTFRIKTAALKQGMNNMKKSCIYMLRDGLIEYMRLAVEELVEISKSSRNLNAFQGKNLQVVGAVQNSHCYDDS